jgi:hypothetical protein
LKCADGSARCADDDDGIGSGHWLVVFHDS